MPQPAWGCTHGLVGQSPEIAKVRRLIEKASRNRLPVLLLGESGTGKEVVARGIYNANPRGQFVPIDCGSLVGTLMESELFGHTKGSFTGAVEVKKGLLDLAEGGTAFFDEIGDLPLELQVKLLRLLQESEYRAVGSLQWRKVDIRVIAATHRDLRAEVAAGRFRQDLYYRLNVFSMRLPALRDRKEDVPHLLDHFMELAASAGLSTFRPSVEVIEALTCYDWPGNVRELKHFVDRMAAMNSEGVLHMADVPSPIQNFQASRSLQTLADSVDPRANDCQTLLPELTLASAFPVISIPDANRQAIFKALAATNGERGKAAAMLGISRTTLFRKMKQYKLA